MLIGPGHVKTIWGAYKFLDHNRRNKAPVKSLVAYKVFRSNSPIVMARGNGIWKFNFQESEFD